MDINNNQKKYLMKVILLGDTFTGKTNLNNVYFKQLTNNNDINLPTIGVDFSCKKIDISNDVNLKVQCWDTAGQESYRTIIRGYYRNACGIILFFNLTRRNSFNNLEYWLNEIKTFSLCDHDHPILLLGTYSDLHLARQIKKSEAIEFANKHNLMYHELNTFDYENIDLVLKSYFFKLFKKMKDTNCDGLKPLKQAIIQKQDNPDLLIFDKVDDERDNNDDKTCCVIS